MTTVTLHSFPGWGVQLAPVGFIPVADDQVGPTCPAFAAAVDWVRWNCPKPDGTYQPADAGDFRFVITDLAEAADRCGYSAFEDGGGIQVLVVDDTGAVISDDRVDTMSQAYDMVEAAREVQAVPDFEERMAMYAERGW